MMVEWAGLLFAPSFRIVALGSAIIGALAGVVGCIALLRREALLGDALAHAALPGVCIGFLAAGGRNLPLMLAGAIATALAVVLFIRTVRLNTPLKPDAALGLGLSVFFAGGVVLLTAIQAGGGASQGGLSTFLFGQAAAMLASDVMLAATVALAAAGLISLFWTDLKLALFDRSYARTMGLPLGALDIGLACLMTVTIVIGLQLAGVVMMVALLVAPAVAARQWAGTLGAMLVIGGAIGAASGIAGAAASAVVPAVATGPSIVLAATAAAVVSLLFAPGRGLIARRVAKGRRKSLNGAEVLSALQKLGAAHGNPAYPTEQGMLDALFGPGARHVLARLEDDGLVRRVTHAPETTPHFELTEAGRDRALGREAKGRGA
jgi:manganese/zinc/iron transport system permease protein